LIESGNEYNKDHPYWLRYLT